MASPPATTAVLNAISTIRRNVPNSGKWHDAVKICQSAIDDAAKENVENFMDSVSSDVYYDPFRHALSNTKTRLLAINTISKLASSHYLSNRMYPDGMPEDGTIQKSLVEDAVSSIYDVLQQPPHSNEIKDAGVTALSTLVTETTEVHGEPLRLVMQCFFALHAGSTQGLKDRTATALHQVMAVLFSRLEASKNEDEAKVLAADAARMYTGLCNKAKIPPNMDPRSPRGRRDRESRILAFQLLNTSLSNAGAVFSENTMAIEATQRVLVTVLLEALQFTDHSDELFFTAMETLYRTFTIFQAHLKNECGALLSWVLKGLQADFDCKLTRRMSVLRFIIELSKEPANIIAIFLNYDCDPTQPHILSELLVARLGPIIGGDVGTRLGVSASECSLLQMSGTSAMLAILDALERWSAQPPVPSGSTDIGRLEETRAHKDSLEKAIDLFNKKPKKGVARFVELGIMPDTPEAIARFILHESRLSKLAIGDLLGEHEDYYKKIMYEFVDLIDMKGIRFLPALRLLLSTFILPGEPQKIDRIAEKFGDRYVAQNPALEFKFGDTVYGLAMATILLNSDQHNPSNPRRMNLQDFIKNTGYIDAQHEMTPRILTEIFEEIGREPIMADPTICGPIADKTPAEIKDEQIKLARGLIGRLRTQKNEAEYIVPKWRDYGHFVFGSCGWSILASLSITLETADDFHLVQSLLKCFKSAVHIASAHHMGMFCEVFVSALAKFTHLVSVDHISPKNIEVIRVLCELAQTNANDLGGSWTDVLRCLSELERLQMIGTGPDIRSGPTTLGPDTNTEMTNVRSVTQFLDRSMVDRVFLGSVQLHEEALVHFLSVLCSIGAAELGVDDGRHRFTLQKVVEVVSVNMDRELSKFAFIRLWKSMGGLFVDVGASSSLELAMYAVDSLRQLASKFLRKFAEVDEFASMRFQVRFLEPFRDIVRRTDHPEVVEFALRCVQQFIHTEGVTNIRSGWTPIFEILTSSIQYDTSRSTVQTSGLIVSQIAYTFFDLITEHIDALIECVCQLRSQAVDDKVSVNMIDTMARFVELLLDRAESDDAAHASFRFDQDDEALARLVDTHYVPALTAVVHSLSDSRTVVSRQASNVLFNDNGLLQAVMATPIGCDVIDKTLLSRIEMPSAEWSAGIVDAVVSGTARLLTELPTNLMAGDHTILDRFADICLRGATGTLDVGSSNDQPDEVRIARIEQLAQVYCDGFILQLLPDLVDLDLGPPFMRLIAVVAEMLELTFPSEIRSVTGTDVSPETKRSVFHVVRRKSIIQLRLFEGVADLITSTSLPEEAAEVLLAGTRHCLAACRDFNLDLDLRYRLLQAKFMAQLPSMKKQELRGSLNVVRSLRYCVAKSTGEWAVRVREMLIAELGDIIRHYADRAESAFSSDDTVHHEKTEVAAFLDVASYALDTIVGMAREDEASFQTTVKLCHADLVRLIQVAGMFPNNDFSRLLSAVFGAMMPLVMTALGSA
ncbi:Sec7 domain [Carpediemonas membranifera]|uniref:Sec7 domain n=1 Tax=Carpediemonas membranifera TaxID=201153 RepID=A0A8J6E431_9EUKA|nr:Sec7 domain [Carpediemonas membranifera]|eukprot:KAG9393952.1 Sec7 domain [Carpediemonas membranifera]